MGWLELRYQNESDNLFLLVTFLSPDKISQSWDFGPRKKFLETHQTLTPGLPQAKSGPAYSNIRHNIIIIHVI